MSARFAPTSIALIVLISVTSLALRAPAAVRLVPMLAVLVALPGLAVSRHLQSRSRFAAVPIGAAVGIAWLVLASEVLVYSRWWKPAALIPATLCMSALAAAVPVHRAAHGLRWDAARRTSVGLSVASTGLFIAAQTLSLRRTPYSADELKPLQFAWMKATGARNGTVSHSGSTLGWLETWLIPFHRASTGTLLAARWLELGFLALTVALAGIWARSFTGRRGQATSWAILIAAAAAIHTEQLRPGTAIAAPLLMGAGYCLTPTRDTKTRPGFGGVLLGAAALGSRTCALAAAALAIWAILQARAARRPITFPAWAGPIRRMIAGIAVAAITAVLLAVVADARIPSLSETERASRRGGSTVFALWFAAFVVITLLASVRHRQQRAGRSGLRRGMCRNGPVLALAGACLGALLEQGPVLGELSVPLLLLALSTAKLVWSDQGPELDVARQPLASAPDRSARTSRWQIGITLMIVAIPIAGRFAELDGTNNEAQLARISYLLQHSGPYDAVFDPSHTVGVMRVPIGRADLDQAAFAIVPPSMLSGDLGLQSALRAGFEPTPYADVWRATLRWSTPPLTLELPFTAGVSGGSPATQRQ